MTSNKPYGSLFDERNGAAALLSTNDERRQLLQHQSTLSSTQGGGGGFGSEAVGAVMDGGTIPNSVDHDNGTPKKDESYLCLSLRNTWEENLLLDTNDFRKRYSSVHNDPDVEHLQNRENLWGSTRMLDAYLKNQAESRQGRRHRRNMSDSGIPLPANHLPKPTVPSDGIVGVVSSSTRSLGQSLSRIMFEHVDLSGPWYELTPGSIQQSVVVATVIAVVNGVACWVYYTLLETCLEFFWHTLPKTIGATEWPESLQWMWIPIISVLFCALNGFAVVLLGEPGDMSFTISCVHGKGYIPTDHVMPMVVASFCSIVAAGSLGPEAPLVAICGALGGFVSRRIFGERHRNVVRKHTLMGMAGALSAFFGAPLGGSLFALEINSRFGVEYFEHLAESVRSRSIPSASEFKRSQDSQISTLFVTCFDHARYFAENSPWLFFEPFRAWILRQFGKSERCRSDLIRGMSWWVCYLA